MKLKVGLMAVVLLVASIFMAAPATAQTAGERGLGWYQANTGIQAGHTLTVHGSGDWTLTSADSGKTFNDMQVNGSVITTAATNVTFNDLKAYRVVNANGGGGVVYNHCELDGTNLPNNDVYDNQANDGTYNFCNIHNGFRGVQWGKSVTVLDSWVHDLRELTSGTHRCGMATNGMDPGGAVLIQRTWDDPGDWGTELSGSLCLYGDFAQVHDVTVTGTYFGDSGSYLTYDGSCSGKQFPVAARVVIANDQFADFPVSHPPGGQYGPGSCYAVGNGDAWYGNTKLSDGSVISHP